jgi:N-acetylglucosamine kinase-like BadF-type ATPase
VNPSRVDDLLLGIDGGNTKTIALLATPGGTVVGTGRIDRNGDVYKVGIERATEVHREAADLALSAAGVDSSRPITAVLSSAGADWPEDIEELRAAHAMRWPGVTVVNDALGALRAAVPDGPGVVIVCGTGTATGARGPDGATWHSSFWQEPQGAHELGVRTLQAVYRAELGIDPPTMLTARVLRATGEPSVEALLHHATGRHVAARRDPAVVAWVLLDAADEGDDAARGIVARHGASLGATAVAAARKVGIDRASPFDLALAGGVFRHPASALRAAIADAVREAAPRVRVTAPELEPAAGALLLAFDAAGLPAGPRVRARIAEALGAVDLFDTHPLRGGGYLPR